jgi:hypothetical protein
MSVKFKSILGLGLLYAIFLVIVDTKDVKECFFTYPIKEKYTHLSKTHTWVTSSDTLISYKNNLKDGISISFEKDAKYNKVYFFVSNYILGKEDAFSFIYVNGKLSNIDTYNQGLHTGISISFNKNHLDWVRIYDNNKAIGSVDFWSSGMARSIKFGSKFYNKSGVGHNDTYDNGQKAFEYLEENGTKYWVVYNPEGGMLVKYPTDNDFCKAKFYEDGKEVKIPYYFDQKEFEEIYEKIKNDFNKSKNH